MKHVLLCVFLLNAMGILTYNSKIFPAEIIFYFLTKEEECVLRVQLPSESVSLPVSCPRGKEQDHKPLLAYWQQGGLLLRTRTEAGTVQVEAVTSVWQVLLPQCSRTPPFLPLIRCLLGTDFVSPRGPFPQCVRAIDHFSVKMQNLKGSRTIISKDLNRNQCNEKATCLFNQISQTH